MKTLIKILFFFLILVQLSLAQWVLTNAPHNVPIYVFTCDGSNVFAGSDLTSLVATGGTVFLSTNNGLDWSIIGVIPDCPEIRAIVLDDNKIFAGSFGGGVFLSTNMGVNWTDVNNGLTNTDVYTLLITPNGLGGKNMYAGTMGGGVFISTNYGANWSSINNGLTNLGIYSLDFIQTPVNDIILFAGTGGSGVFVSTNNGAIWTQTSLNNDYAWTLAAIGNNIFASSGGLNFSGLFRSSNNGVSWVNVGPPFQDLAISGTNLFGLAGGSTVHLTTNNGTSWMIISQGILDTMVNAIGINGNYIFAGGENGVWRRPLSEVISAVENLSVKPINFSLEQNYPNPFNPTTTIGFGIPERSHVRMSILNILGEEIKILLNKEKEAGYHSVDFDASNLPSGIYFYQLQSGKFTAVNKMLLLR